MKRDPFYEDQFLVAGVWGAGGEGGGGDDAVKATFEKLGGEDVKAVAMRFALAHDEVAGGVGVDGHLVDEEGGAGDGPGGSGCRQ